MASLTYLIYQENRRDKDGPIPCDERYKAMFSSFRQKSIVLESGNSARRESSARSIPSDPPKIRELIEESGILEELELDKTVDANPEAGDEKKSDRNYLVRRPPSIRVDDKLRKVVDEVLKWDNNDSVHSRSSGVHSQSMISESSSALEQQSQSTTSRHSTTSSFEEVPYHRTPQFNPATSTKSQLDMNLRKSSPPRLEDSQPSRPSLRMLPPTGFPSKIEASRHKTSRISKENDSITRHNSAQSCETGVSEVTWQYEPNSPQGRLSLNPRAPQYQIAKEQEKEDITVRTNNHSALSLKSAKPPVRRPAPEADSPDPPIRKQSTPTHSRSSVLVTPESEKKTPLNDAIGRKGTIGGSASTQPLPRQGNASTDAVPQDANAVQSPVNQVSHKEDIANEKVASRQAAMALLIKPTGVKRRSRAKPITPDHDLSSRLFPHGIGYYSRSPRTLPAPPNRIPSPLANPPRISLRHQLRPLLAPLGNDSSEDISRLGSQSSRLSSSELTSDEEACETSDTNVASTTTETSIRVQLVPREITFHFEGQKRVHTGLYTGPINRHNRIHGNGVFWFNTGDVYLGQFSEGYLHGVGCMTIHMDDGSKQVLRGFFHKNEYVGTENIPDDLEDDIGD